MQFVGNWVKSYKKPIPLKAIIEHLPEVPDRTAKASVRTLVRKGFLRKAIAVGSFASYVQCRSI